MRNIALRLQTDFGSLGPAGYMRGKARLLSAIKDYQECGTQKARSVLRQLEAGGYLKMPNRMPTDNTEPRWRIITRPL